MSEVDRARRARERGDGRTWRERALAAEEENKKLRGKYEAAVAIMAGAELLFPGITVRAMERLPKEESH